MSGSDGGVRVEKVKLGGAVELGAMPASAGVDERRSEIGPRSLHFFVAPVDGCNAVLGDLLADRTRQRE